MTGPPLVSTSLAPTVMTPLVVAIGMMATLVAAVTLWPPALTTSTRRPPPTWLGPLSAVVIGALVGSPLVMLAGPSIWFLLRSRLAYRHRRQAEVEADESLRRLVGGVGQQLRAGLPLAEALRRNLAQGGPWSEPFSELSGLRMDQALDTAAQQSHGDRQLVFSTMSLLVDGGSSSLETVDRLAGVIDARRAARADAATQAAQARASSWLVGGLPLVFASGVAMVDGRALNFFVTSWVGAGCIVGSAVCSAVGWLWMQQITEEALR